MRQLKWSLLAAYAAVCVVVWPRLPARIPLHFALNGTVDRWVERNFFVWLGLPLLLGVIFLLIDLSAKAATQRAEYWNVPEKKRFLALTDEQRAPIFAELRRMLDVVCLFLLAVFVAIHTMMYIVSVHGQTHFRFYFPLLTVGFSASLIGYVIVFNFRVKRLILAASDHSAIGRMK